jgi:hypothetical protein
MKTLIFKNINYTALTRFVWMTVIVALVDLSLLGCSQQTAAPPSPAKVTNSSERAAVHKPLPKPESPDGPLVDPSPVTR